MAEKFSSFSSNIVLHTNLGKEKIKNGVLLKIVNYEEFIEQHGKEKYKNELLKNSDNDDYKFLYIRKTNENNLEKYIESIFEEMSENGELVSYGEIKIALIHDDYENYHRQKTKYDWIHKIDIAIFKDEEEAVKWITDGLNQSEINTEYFYSDITKTDFLDFYPDVHSSIYVQGFFRNAMVEKDPFRAIMLMYDFIEFILYIYYYYGKKCTNEEVKLNHIMSYEDLGKEIDRLFEKHPMNFEYSKYEVPFDLKNGFKKIKKYFGLEIKGDYINFLGCIMILQQLRNCTKGHGVIIGKSAKALREFLVQSIMFILGLTEFNRFDIIINEDKIKCGYRDIKIVDMDPYIILCDKQPYILYEEKKRKEYINYFDGKYAIPEIQ